MYNNNNNNNNNNTDQITDIATLQFIHKLRNFTHIISICSSHHTIYVVPVLAGYAGGYPATSGSGRISNMNPVHLYFELENVAIAKALQLEAARRRAVPISFNTSPVARLKSLSLSVAVLERIYC